jgi:hypothetical protein
VLGAAVFGPCLGGGFIFDDHTIVGGNMYVHSFVWWRRWFTHDFWDVTEEVRRFGNRLIYWRPGVNASYALDWQLGHGSPMFFHVMNLLWQAVASVLAFAVLRRWIGAAVPAMLAALVFALHPSKAESVAWIAGRTDVLCAVAMLAATEGYARRIRGQKGGLALEIVGTVAAYTIKEQAVGLAAFVAVEAWVALGRPALDWTHVRKIAKACVPQLAVGLAYMLVRARIMPVRPGALPALSLAARASDVAETMGRFAAITFFPHDLSLQQALRERLNGVVVVDPTYIAIGVIFVSALFALIWIMRKRQPGVSVGVAFYLLMLLPTSNVVPTGMATMLSERFLYIPLLGLSLAVGVVLATMAAKSSKHFAVAATACVIGCVALGIVAARHAADFSDERAFWDRELALHPHSLEALRFKIGDESKEHHFDKALELTARAQQTTVAYFPGTGYEIDFIVLGVQLTLLKIPDHDATSLKMIDRFLESLLDPQSKTADLSLGALHIVVALENQTKVLARVAVQRPLIDCIRSAVQSRLVNDSQALDLAELAQRECPGCTQIARIAALIAGRAGRYDVGNRFLDGVANWTSATDVLDTRKVLSDAEDSGKASMAAEDEPHRLQLRATELATLEAWGRAYDVLAPQVDAIRHAPQFAMGFAELAWRAGEFRTARDVLSGMMPPTAVAATTEQWSRKMGWIDGSNALGLTHAAGHGKEGP